MATTATKKTAKSGPKDRSYVNKAEKYEVKRKSPAKEFGGGKGK